jgi:hypothetical protein
MPTSRNGADIAYSEQFRRAAIRDARNLQREAQGLRIRAKLLRYERDYIRHLAWSALSPPPTVAPELEPPRRPELRLVVGGMAF